MIFFPTAALTWVLHDRTAEPSSSTVHAPHWPSPQPYLVPVSSRRSRKTFSRVSSGATSTVCSFPLTKRVSAIPKTSASAPSFIRFGERRATSLSQRNVVRRRPLPLLDQEWTTADRWPESCPRWFCRDSLLVFFLPVRAFDFRAAPKLLARTGASDLSWCPFPGSRVSF